LTLSTEHRAAASRDHIPLKLGGEGEAISLSLIDPAESEQCRPIAPQNSAAERICKALAGLDHPITLQDLRSRCAMRTASLCSTLNELCQQGIIIKGTEGYMLPDNAAHDLFPVSLSQPIQSAGNGNGKHPS
jgi:hypothetical protein